MSEKDIQQGLGGLMGLYIDEKAGTEAPVSLEREVLRAIPFDKVESNLRGRGMELPSFLSVIRDDDSAGPYVRISWGYSDGHHRQSGPIEFIDRRTAIVSLAPERGDVRDVKLVLERFKQLSGICQEVSVLNRVVGRPVRELNIVDAQERHGGGTFSFEAQGDHSPKGIPLGFIAMEQLGNHLVLNELGRTVSEQNGIYRSISFSSRTGRHSGWGYVLITPAELEHV